MHFTWSGWGETKKSGLLFSQAIYSAMGESNLFINSYGYN